MGSEPQNHQTPSGPPNTKHKESRGAPRLNEARPIYDQATITHHNRPQQATRVRAASEERSIMLEARTSSELRSPC
jgi:hypothetical protein